MSFLDIFSNIRKAQPAPSEAPSHWVKCDGCGALMYHKEVEACFNVCPKCGYHMRLKPSDRINLICDEGTFTEFDANLKPVDPLNFVDKKSYKKRIAESKEKTGRTSSVICGEGECNGRKIQLVVFDFGFMGGSMGSVVGAKFVKAAEKAMELNCPFICFSASGGARMQEALFSLMQMAKTSAVLARMREKGVPFISVLTDPTLGGVSASFAMLGDLNIAEPKALIGFAGPRVIEQTVREKLPEGFQRSEFLLEKGAIDMIVKRGDMRRTLASVLSKLTNQPSPFAESEFIQHEA